MVQIYIELNDYDDNNEDDNNDDDDIRSVNIKWNKMKVIDTTECRINFGCIIYILHTLHTHTRTLIIESAEDLIFKTWQQKKTIIMIWWYNAKLYYLMQHHETMTIWREYSRAKIDR